MQVYEALRETFFHLVKCSKSLRLEVPPNDLAYVGSDRGYLCSKYSQYRAQESLANVRILTLAIIIQCTLPAICSAKIRSIMGKIAPGYLELLTIFKVVIFIRNVSTAARRLPWKNFMISLLSKLMNS